MADERTAPDLRPDHVRRGEARGGRAAETLPDAARAEQLGRYQLLFELARGGMGVVHVARLVGAHGFDRIFALKRPLAKDAPPGEIASFLDEARLPAKIHHPNVVETLDLGEHDGAPFLVMTFVPGVSLARLLARLRERGALLDPWIVAWIMREVASGLAAAHELKGDSGEPLGLVHRDVSPENVLLSFDGRALVTDFGVAKWRLAERSTESGVAKGKFAYMAPEQTRAERVDLRADVFALGVVAYEALVGRRLFAGSSPAETVRRVLEEVPEDPRAERPEVPEELAALVLKCLEKDPARRPGTAGEVAAEVRGLLRRERRVVDGSDVAALLAQAFPGARERLMERVERAARAAERSLEEGFFEGGQSAPPDAGGASESHASITRAAASLGIRSTSRARRRTVILAAIGAVALATGALVLRQRTPSAAGEPNGTSPVNGASHGDERPTAGVLAPQAAASVTAVVASGAAASTGTAGASGAMAPTGAASAPATTTNAALAPSPTAPSKKPVPPASASASAVQTAAPKGSVRAPTSKGAPFRSLGE